MKLLFFIVLFILIIIFLPLPLKISIYFSKENYYIKLFKFTILKKDKEKSIKKTKKQNKNNTKIPYIHIIKKIDKKKYKPTLSLRGNINYSLSDSSNTAILYGIINSILPLIYRAMNILFKIKKSNLHINPIFNNSFLFDLNINCIIFISLGQIINIFFSIISVAFKEKYIMEFNEKI